MSRGDASLRVCIAPIAFFIIFSLGTVSLFSQSTADETLNRALDLIRQSPFSTVQHDYIMSARIRLLLFWTGSDDVGGGYIRKTTHGAGSSRSIQVLFGSDPKKAPRAINRWGAASERIDSATASERTSAIFGFMKTTKGKTASEMEKELSKEIAAGEYFFDAILGNVRPGHSVSRVVSFRSTVDFDFHDFDKASAEAISKLQAQTKEPRELELNAKNCNETRSFLFAVDEAGRLAVAGSRAPITTCYVYNSRAYTLTLREISKVAEHRIKVKLRNSKTPMERKYTGLVRTEFQVRNQSTGELTNFSILYGASGATLGVPVQIRHQPNWWFQVILDLV